MKKPFHRNLGIFLATLLAACTLDLGAEPEEPADECSKTCKQARELVEAAKVDISLARYADATEKCEDAEAIDATYQEATYCILASNVGTLAQSITSILNLMFGSASPRAYDSQINVKQVVSSLLGDIELALMDIDATTYRLAAMERPTFQIASFPIELNRVIIMTLTDGYSSTAKLELGGTWDKSEVLLLGAIANAALAGLDYALAHELVLDNSEFDFYNTEGIGTFLGTNPRLLSRDTDAESKERLAGGANRKGLKKDVQAALAYLAGRATDLAQVSPAHAGLPAAIQDSIAMAATDAVIQWYDKDGDGFPEKVYLPFLAELQRDASYGPLPLGDGTIETFWKGDTWAEIFRVLRKLSENLDGTEPEPVALQALINLVARDATAYGTNIRILRKAAPDALALDPAPFFDAPKVVGELIPSVYSYTFDDGYGYIDERFDLAMETEGYLSGDNLATKSSMNWRYDAADYAHFIYATPDAYLDGSATAYRFDTYGDAPAQIVKDGIVPSPKSPKLWYLGLQDPAFGGLLMGDPAFTQKGAGGKYQVMNNQQFSLWFNKVIKYYCFDFSGGTLDGMFEDADVYWDNAIEDCDQPF